MYTYEKAEGQEAGGSNPLSPTSNTAVRRPGTRTVRLGRAIPRASVLKRPCGAERVAATSQAVSGAIARAGFWPGFGLRARSYADAVMEVNDAVSEPSLIEKFELRADVVWQGALAASHHDRAQEQMALVD